MSTLSRLFNPKRLDSIDPNKPENVPLLKKGEELKNQAYVTWYNDVGHFAIDPLETALIGDIIKAIAHPRDTEDNRVSNLRLLDRIEQNLKFVDYIVNAFEQEKKRKSKK